MNKTYRNAVLDILFALFIYKAVKWYSWKTGIISKENEVFEIKSKSTLRAGPLNCYNSELVTKMNVIQMITCRKIIKTLLYKNAILPVQSHCKGNLSRHN